MLHAEEEEGRRQEEGDLRSLHSSVVTVTSTLAVGLMGRAAGKQ